MKVEKTLLRRGSVGFTSCNHTAEDQIVMAFGNNAGEAVKKKFIANTELFGVMCSCFGVSHVNPVMDENEAKKFIKTVSAEDWLRHCNNHVA